MRESVYNSVYAVPAIATDAHTATVTGATVDRRSPALSNFRAACLVVLAGTVTDGTHAVKIQVSNDGTTWADAPAGSVQGAAISLGAAGSDTVTQLGYTGPERYLRAVSTVTGTPTTGGIYGAVFLLSGARRTPIPRS